MAKEALAQSMLLALLGASFYRLTPEFCKADGGYGSDLARQLGLQVKSSSKHTVKGRNSRCKCSFAWKFHSAQGYGDMIIICKPFDAPISGWLVIPGSVITKTDISFSWGGSYKKYFIVDDELSDYLARIAVAAATSENVQLPGSTSDIFETETLSFHDVKDLCMPTSPTQKLAQLLVNKRSELLPAIKFEMPDIQGTPVDTVVDGWRLQDKTLHKGKGCWMIPMWKSGGIKGGKTTKVPYDSEDFDFLYVHCPEEEFLLISAQLLTEHSVLHSDITDGKKQVYVTKNHWMQQYKYSYKDPEVSQKFLEVLRRQ